MRARDIGIRIGAAASGPGDAITDVPGIRVGHTTLIEGEGPLVVGRGPVRTGVTVIVPHERVGQVPLFAGCHRLNGNGELTGLEWVREAGMLTSPLALTNTHSVGVVRDALIAARVRTDPAGDWWSLPVVGETWDGTLNDVNGQHVRPEHVEAALSGASAGPVEEGNVGGGTGMICHGFKGGIGTASRVLATDDGGYTIGVLVQANYGSRNLLTIAGVPVGREISDLLPVSKEPDEDAGSIIVVLATDAPLLPHQLKRLARRIPLGIGLVGGRGGNTSGDIFIAFSTANPEGSKTAGLATLTMLPNERITPLFNATAEATEEAIVNALVAADTMTGVDGHTVYALPHDQLREVLRKYNRLVK
jgi:D-aminopeptidase